MPLDAFAGAPDDALLVAYANGDAAAAQALSMRLLPRVYSQATRILGDWAEAEDIAQEAMLRLWRIAPEWRQGEAKVTTWLYRVVANLCTDRLRSRRPSVPIEDREDIEDGARGQVADLIEADRASALQAALEALPDRQRLAVILRHIEGLSNPEIAEIMDIKVEAVESLTARGKRGLAALLKGRKAELGYDDE